MQLWRMPTQVGAVNPDEEDEFAVDIDWSSIELPTPANMEVDEVDESAKAKQHNNPRWVQIRGAYKILRLVHIKPTSHQALLLWYWLPSL